MIKIIAGEFRSRQLRSPENDSVSRPYTSRVKESVFNHLRGWFDGTTVIDLFAGVGTMGLEAASRGAASVFIVERDRKVFDLLKSNIDALKCADRVTAVNSEVLSMMWLNRAPRPADVIFVDPPYSLMEDDTLRQQVLEMIAKCRPLMNDTGFVVLRSPISSKGRDFSIAGYAGPEEHAYGHEMNVMLYAPARGSSESAA